MGQSQYHVQKLHYTSNSTTTIYLLLSLVLSSYYCQCNGGNEITTNWTFGRDSLDRHNLAGVFSNAMG